MAHGKSPIREARKRAILRGGFARRDSNPGVKASFMSYAFFSNLIVKYFLHASDILEFVSHFQRRLNFGQSIDGLISRPTDWGTNLDMLLRSNAIETVVVTGCTTEGCVESTARDALFNDYYVVLPEDCVASDDSRQHEASLFLMCHRFDVVSSDDILPIWKRHQATGMNTDNFEIRNHFCKF